MLVVARGGTPATGVSSGKPSWADLVMEARNQPGGDSGSDLKWSSGGMLFRSEEAAARQLRCGICLEGGGGGRTALVRDLLQERKMVWGKKEEITVLEDGDGDDGSVVFCGRRTAAEWSSRGSLGGGMNRSSGLLVPVEMAVVKNQSWRLMVMMMDGEGRGRERGGGGEG